LWERTSGNRVGGKQRAGNNRREQIVRNKS
jgi:hypothetical protein